MKRKRYFLAGLVPFIFFLACTVSFAADIPFPSIKIGVDQAKSPQDVAMSIQILLVLTVLSLAPAILIMTTSFTRVVIVLAFLRQGLGTQQVPPNKVLIGLALFLTFFIMRPTFERVDKEALTPYLAGRMSTA